MFGLLNPFALWLAPLIAAPLVIHFLGRSEPKRLDFPSLMPVKGQLTHAMRRHKLKNWLQLLLRTLALLFLLLAAANPLWRSRNSLTPPAASALLIHNGAYANIPASEGGTLLDAEQRMQHGLDSLTSGNNHTELLFPDASTREPVARFGRYPEALPRLLRQAGNQPSFHLHLPVFDWRDLEASEEILLQGMTENPGMRLVLTEYPDASRHLTPFSGFALAFPKENIATFRAANLASTSGPALWNPAGGTPREIQMSGDSVEILLPVSQTGWMNGELTLPPPQGDRFAFPSAAISARIPPPSTLCHVGNAFASLASLGRGGLRLQIHSFADAHGMEAEHCDFLYLADPKEMDASLLGRAAEIARNGGKVILGLGHNTDLALLNRNLLEPLGIGRLVELKQHTALAIKANSAAFSRLGIRIESWGAPGQVKSHVALQRDIGVSVLLSAGDDPILIHRQTGRGSLLLWTTDVDDPSWTDVGLGPWVALIHQIYAEGTWSSGIGMQWIASDSSLLLPASESDEIRMIDPSGSPLPQPGRDPEGWRAGPFDRLGTYRVERRERDRIDTSWIAVGLASNRLQPGTDDRERFLSAMEAVETRITLREAGGTWQNLYGGFRLRTWLLGVAALLLFLEGVISLRLRPASFAARRD